MSILAAIFKHLYQRPSIWIWHAIFISVCFGFVMLSLNQHQSNYGFSITILLFLNYLFGLEIGATLKDVLNKPFTFFLPGHQTVTFPMALISGAIFNLIFSVLAFMTTATVHQELIGFLPIFFSALTMYLLIVTLSIKLRQSQFLVFFIFLINFISIFQITNRIADLILLHPIFWTIVGLATIFFFQNWLKSKSLARYLRTTPSISLFESYNRQKLKRFSASLESRPTQAFDSDPSTFRDRFFISRLRRSEPFSLVHDVWGMIYTRILKMPPARSWGYLLFLAFPILFSYTPVHSNYSFFLLIMFAAAFGAAAKDHLHFYLMLPMGRVRQFWATMIYLFILSVLSTLSILIYSVVWWAVTVSFPQVDVGGKTFYAADIYPPNTLLTLLVMPFFFIMMRIKATRPILGTFLSLVSILTVIFVVNKALPSVEFISASPLIVIFAFVLCWALCGLAIYHFFKTANLLISRKIA